MLLRRTYEIFIYYTDWHKVDEDIATIPFYGGGWNSETGSGIAYRCMYDPLTVTGINVASSNIQDVHLLYGLS
jgi:hypothetical protein